MWEYQGGLNAAVKGPEPNAYKLHYVRCFLYNESTDFLGAINKKFNLISRAENLQDFCLLTSERLTRPVQSLGSGLQRP